MEKKFIEGYEDFADRLQERANLLPCEIADVVIPTKRSYLAGHASMRIAHEPHAPGQQYITHPNSLDCLINPGWNVMGVKRVADVLGVPVRTAERILSRHPELYEKWNGRVFSCANSLYHYRDKKEWP